MSADIIGGAATGVAQIVGSAIGGRARRERQDQAQAQVNRDLNTYRNQAIVDPYANTQNFQEEGVVDTQAAEFDRQTSQQNLANVLGNFQQGGGAGIAGSAQALANAATQAGQGASATISQQVQANQAASRQGAMAAQEARARGQQYVQGLQDQRNQNLLNISQNELDSATAARQAAHQDLVGGIGNVAGAVAGAFTGGVGGGLGSGDNKEKVIDPNKQ